MDFVKKSKSSGSNKANNPDDVLHGLCQEVLNCQAPATSQNSPEGVLLAKGQVLTVRYPDGRTTSLGYNPSGQLNEVVQHYGENHTVILVHQDGQWIDITSGIPSPGGIKNIQVDNKGNIIYKLEYGGAPVQQIVAADGSQSTINLKTSTLTRLCRNSAYIVQEITYPDGSKLVFKHDQQGHQIMTFVSSDLKASAHPPAEQSLRIDSYSCWPDGSCGYTYTDSQGQPQEKDLDSQGRPLYDGPTRIVDTESKRTTLR